MGEITIAAHEREALRSLDTNRLSKLIDQAVNEERSGELHRLRLTDCGSYVASKLRSFESALADHGKAKAAKKRAETEDRLRCAGSDLESAVSQMKQRLDREEADERLFQIDDRIMPPYRLTERMSVRVTYRWRKTIEDEWAHGSITVSHDVDERPDYTLPAQKRKPSAAKREQDRQDKLYRVWEHLMQLTLYSVRDYFREGRDGSEIPQAFKAISDGYPRTLNNYSVEFWRKRP